MDDMNFKHHVHPQVFFPSAILPISLCLTVRPLEIEAKPQRLIVEEGQSHPHALLATSLMNCCSRKKHEKTHRNV